MSRCAYCIGNGWVAYRTRTQPVLEITRKDGKRCASANNFGAYHTSQVGEAAYDEYAPCPYCDEGRLLEFPAPDAKGKARVGPWGETGFWQGRSTRELRPLDTGGGDVAPPPEFLVLAGRELKEIPA